MHRSKTLTLVVLAALLLSACSSAATPTIRPATQAQATATERPATSVPTETTAAAPTSTEETQPAATATRKPEEATPAQKPPSATDTPAPAVSPFLEVGPDEWVHGPADAPVTIIEYADFQ